VVNDGSGTPEEAARWVSYCNAEPDTGLGRQRAANGHAAPYSVQLWGVGNEVWGEWQIGHTDAHSYAERLRLFVEDMRFTDPSIAIVAVGAAILSDDPDDPGRLWNEVVLREASDIIDGLSFHIYQPGMEGWQEKYDPNQMHSAICAEPLDVEAMIQRMETQIHQLAPGREISVVLDEWNLQLPPGDKAYSMHDQAYTARDALYAAGVLNVFQRNCNSLAVANVAQLVNVMGLINANETGAFATPMYYPFLLYRNMERVALQVQVEAPTFDSPPLGNIRAHAGVAYIDAAATRSEDGSRAALALSNLHPANKARVTVHLNGFNALKPVKAWLLSGQEPLATNTFELPDRVKAVEISLPALRGNQMEIELPACSLAVVTLG
jgi:alpha-N-arabinofuranosidase